MRRCSSFALLSSVLGVTSLIAGCAPSATQLVVVVDTDMAIPGEIDEVRLEVTRPDGTSEVEMRGVATRMALPLSVGVIADGEVLGPIDVIATGYHDGDFVIDRTATVTLVRGETRVLSLFLLSNCRDVDCDEGETCGEGGTCRGEEIEDLPPFTGMLPSIDAGIDGAIAPTDASTDTPRMDGAMTPDVPLVACSSDADCDDGIACTTDRCGETSCEHTGNDGACDDGNVCTDDVCTVGVGCSPIDNTSPCPDDVYCNGTDVCSGGVCTHPGDPCSAPTSCDETANACVGCITRADCPADTTGAFGSCDYSGDCDASATRTRTDLTYACTGGMCVPTPTPVNEPCTRVTEDTSCGVGSCGGYAACTAFSDTCDQSGTETRTCTDLLCTSGACMARPRMDSRACTRVTNGTGCGTSCGGWGTCMYASTCATAGTQSRTCTDSTCAGGTCTAGSPRTEMQACGTRVTTGVDCGSTCGVPGPCGGFISECDQTGTANSTCTPRTCSSGMCVTGSPIIEPVACTRVTTGLTCDVDTCSMGFGTCGSGRCQGTSACFSPCECNNNEPFGTCVDNGSPPSICAVAFR
jgi:hypothetical protein